jgi:toxin FitB
MLLDSNIIIYAALPEYSALQDFIAKHAPAVSAISRVEVLGYHLLTQQDRSEFEEFFAAATVLPVSDLVITKAIELRQVRKLKLGDAYRRNGIGSWAHVSNERHARLSMDRWSHAS